MRCNGNVKLVEIAPGAFHLPRYLALDKQREVLGRCRALMEGEVPGYVPTVRGGGVMHVRMLCLGRHWNGKLYQYEPTRSDFDGLAVPPLPSGLRELANEIAASTGMRLDADLCIMNYYDASGRMGLRCHGNENSAHECKSPAVRKRHHSPLTTQACKVRKHDS